MNDDIDSEIFHLLELEEVLKDFDEDALLEESLETAELKTESNAQQEDPIPIAETAEPKDVGLAGKVLRWLLAGLVSLLLLFALSSMLFYPQLTVLAQTILAQYL